MIRDTHLALHEVIVPAGTEWNANLQGWLFLRLHRGEGYVFRSKGPLLLSEGDTLVHPPSRPFQLRASQLGELRLQYFQVLPELLVGTLSAAERQHLERAAQADRIFPQHRSAASPFAQSFAGLAQSSSTLHAFVARCEILRLSAQIFTEFLPAATTVPHAFLRAKQRFELLVTQMVEGELQHKSPKELARQCGCGVRHFSRLFRDYFGRSLVPKRIEMSLLKAKQLLEESDAKIIDVALECGFNHVGLFSSRFKKRFGLTPSEWRRRQTQTNGPRVGLQRRRSPRHHSALLV